MNATEYGVNEYQDIEHLLDEVYAARWRWERREWATTPRAMGSVAMGGTGIDDALDALNEHWELEQAIDDFERVFDEE